MALSNGEFFGEEDILNETHRTYSVICHSNKGQLLMIKKSIFLNRICCNNNTLEYL